MSCLGNKSIVTELLFTFIDPTNWAVYMWYNHTSRTLNTLRLKESISKSHKSHKKSIVEYINKLKFLPMLDFYAIQDSIKYCGKFNYKESTTNRVLYFIYLDRLPIDIQYRLDALIAFIGTIRDNHCNISCIKQTLYAPLTTTPHITLKSWYAPSTFILDDKQKRFKIKKIKPLSYRQLAIV